jgi:branched-chain amino acid transport system substrate-binding protein
VPNIIGGERRRSRSRATLRLPLLVHAGAAMPKVARYIKDSVKAKTVAVIYVNNDFGKGGRTRSSRTEAQRHQGRRGHLDRSGPGDFSGPVLKVKQSNADALFVYTNEEESARALRELRKQGYDKPIIGESTLTNER